jgi:enoyl-CoA hydratase
MIHDVFDEERRVAVLTLDRPEVKNALDVPHWKLLAEGVEAAVSAGARAIVITAAGSVFCAGADLNGISVTEMGGRVEATFRAVRDSPVPVIAALNGPAIGAGAQLAVSCDLRVMAVGSRLGIPASAISLPAHPGTIRRLVALAGLGPTRAVLLGGEQIPAERAHAIGLADRVADLSGAVAWAEQIAGYAPRVMRYFKQQLQIDNPADSSSYELLLREVADSEDFAEAMRARHEHRAPVFRDC